MEKPMRIMVLGEAGSGKTTLIKRFLDGDRTFSMRSYLHEDVYTGKWAHGESVLDLELIDVCSNGLDTCYIKLKMSSADAFILMYSKDDVKTSDRLECIKDDILKAKYNAPDVPVFVVRNRSELPESVTWEETDMANTVVWDWEKDYREVSTIHGWQIGKLFRDVIQKCLKVYKFKSHNSKKSANGLTSWIVKTKQRLENPRRSTMR